MNKKRLLIILAFVAATLSPAVATDVFVYDTVHSQPVKNQNHLHSIVVKESSLVINGEDGSLQEIPLTDFNYFRFSRKDQIINAISDVKRLGLDVTFDGSKVKVLGSDRVTRVELYSPDGELKGRIAPKSADFIYDLSALIPGVYIIKLYTPKGVAVRKITRK